MKNPFQSARLTYRAVEATDEAFIHSMNLNPINTANANTALLKPASKKWSAKMHKYISENALLGVIICLTSEETPETSGKEKEGGDGKKDELVPIGQINLSHSRFGEVHRGAEIGIGLKTEYQGKGYGSEAINWILNWAFQSGGVHRVGIDAFEYNEGACRLYEKLGFTRDGRLREAIWFDGRWWDVLEFSMLEQEWRERGKVVKLLE
ncbi:hypothetical protein BP6252_05525 [Coleophoma cylindrospora]|uniref:N-acetyltransferase domain-containing protein n=1 Tax=Coleophoma cylindrospora TaxID=1849047 RepID=A0A3D8RTP5_9HELO|nr:hypothetical protein BP6252_05525 [Coleophoma cylindrospora]